MTKPVLLGYWDMRGLSEPARLMLEYTDTPYEQTRYDTNDHESWQKDKPKLGLAFANIPYLIDGDFKLTESWAIYKYICGQHGLVPTDLKEIAVCDMIAGNLESLVWDFIRLCYLHYLTGDKTKDFEEAKAKYLENAIPTKFGQFDKFLEGKKFLSGEKLMYVDFVFFEALDTHQILYPGIMNDYKNIQAFFGRFQNLEKIASYRSSSRFRKFPIFNTIATWRG